MGSVGRYDSIDLTKFVLAFMVVLIHINPFSAEVNVVVMCRSSSLSRLSSFLRKSAWGKARRRVTWFKP